MYTNDDSGLKSGETAGPVVPMQNTEIHVERIAVGGYDQVGQEGVVSANSYKRNRRRARLADTKGLHPFFSYFGSKFSLAKNYPAPQHKEIIEPFAGSAGYSLLYPDREVILYEVYAPIVELWNYLIHVSEEEILSLSLGPFDKGHPVESLVKPGPARTLLGFWLSESQTSASPYPYSKSRRVNWSERKREMIASQLKYIRHWKVKNLSFDKIPNREATWFVDPPYEEAGKRYRHNEIDYAALGKWCKEREGQTIVCEQNNAKWLNFEHLETGRKEIRNASNNTYRELFWHKTSRQNYEPTPPTQLRLAA